jgi:hypothetical protein
MARARKTQTKVCSVSGIETNVNNFYAKLQRMFNQLNSYV